MLWGFGPGTDKEKQAAVFSRLDTRNLYQSIVEPGPQVTIRSFADQNARSLASELPLAGGIILLLDAAQVVTEFCEGLYFQEPSTKK